MEKIELGQTDERILNQAPSWDLLTSSSQVTVWADRVGTKKQKYIKVGNELKNAS